MSSPRQSQPVTRRDILQAAAVLAAAGAVDVGLARADEPTQAHLEDRVIRNGHVHQTICQWCFPKFSKDELCQLAVKLGYKGIDLVGPEWFPTLKKYDLVGTMTNSHGITKGLNHKENWDMCLGLMRKAIEASADAGYPNIICFSGNREGMDEHEGMKNCAEALKQVVGLAEDKKVNICMELLNSKVDHHDYMCDHSKWGIELVKMVGSPRFKLLYDIYHMQIMEGDVIATIQKNHEYFAHYHTAGVPGRHEIDETQELNYPAVMHAIARTGHTGWVGQEFLPIHDPAASLAQAGKLCDV